MLKDVRARIQAEVFKSVNEPVRDCTLFGDGRPRCVPKTRRSSCAHRTTCILL